MIIINIESHRDGFKGLYTEDFCKYHRFNISPTKHQIIPLETLSAVSSYEDFIDIWQKHCESSEFLKSPVEIKELTLNALRQIDTTIHN